MHTFFFFFRWEICHFCCSSGVLVQCRVILHLMNYRNVHDHTLGTAAFVRVPPPQKKKGGGCTAIAFYLGTK